MKESIKQFDIILVDFGDDILDGEQGGIRPAVVIQNDKGNFYSAATIVMPFTSKISKKVNQPTHALLHRGRSNGLKVDSMLLGECIRQVSKRRILKYIGTITDSAQKKKVDRALKANFI